MSQVTPNTTAAAAVHQMEVALEATGLAGPDQHIAWPAIDILFDSLPPAQRDGFVRRRLLAVRASIDRVTAA